MEDQFSVYEEPVTESIFLFVTLRHTRELSKGNMFVYCELQLVSCLLVKGETTQTYDSVQLKKCIVD